MAFTVEDLRDLAELLRAHPEWREPLWALLASEEVRRMPADLAATREAMERGFRRAARLILALYRAQRRQARETDARFAEMAEAIRRLGETFTVHRQEFVAHQAQTQAQLTELNAAVRNLTEVVHNLIETVRNLAESFITHRQEFSSYQAQTNAGFAELIAEVRALAEAQHSHYEAFIAHRQEFLQQRAETDRRFAELAEAQRRTEESLRRLSEAFEAHRQEFLEHRAETDRRFAELAEAQRRTEESLQRLSEAFTAHREETDRRFAELAEAQRRTEESLQRLSEAFIVHRRVVADDMSVLKKESLERRYRERAAAYFGGPDFHKVRALTFDELMEALGKALKARSITREEYEEARRVDGVIRGRRRQRSMHLALEVSWIIDRGDVERAVRRAEILRKALGETWPAVAGREITEGAREAIERLRREGRPIVVVQDGWVDWPSKPV
jgi:chromosome segregation ATPase